MSEPRLPTKAEYDAASPHEKGFMAYWFSAWPGSEIPNESNCPFPDGSEEAAKFKHGVHAAVIEAIDQEE